MANAKAIAALIAAGVAAGVVGIVLSTDVEDKAELAESEPDEYITVVVEDKDGKQSVERLRTRRAIAKLGAQAKKGDGVDGTVVRVCGNDVELADKCGDVVPKEKRCSLCKPRLADGKVEGALCRHGKTPAAVDCDVDDADCVPWPCVVHYGIDPLTQWRTQMGQAKKALPNWAAQ
jgi:hypothetical protein